MGLLDDAKDAMRQLRQREADAATRRYDYQTKESVEKFEKKFKVPVAKASEDIVETEDGLRFRNFGGVFHMFCNCPDCGQPAETQNVGNKWEVGKQLDNPTLFHHTCGDEDFNTWSHQDAVRELEPVVRPPVEQPAPAPGPQRRRLPLDDDAQPVRGRTQTRTDGGGGRGGRGGGSNSGWRESYSQPSSAPSPSPAPQPSPAAQPARQQSAAAVAAARRQQQREEEAEGGWSIWAILIVLIVLVVGAFLLVNKVRNALQPVEAAPPAAITLEWTEVTPGQVWETTAQAPSGVWKFRVEQSQSVVALFAGPASLPFAQFPSEVFATVEGARQRAGELAAMWQQSGQ